MTGRERSVNDRDLLGAMVLLQRYLLEMDEMSASALGDDPTARVDMRVLLGIAIGGGASPSSLVRALRMPRSTLARALSRLGAAGLVERRADERDGRRAVLALTPSGGLRVARFERAFAAFLDDGSAVVKEILLLLGADPEAREGGPRPPTRELVTRLGAAGAAIAGDIAPLAARYGIREKVDRYAVVYLAQQERRPTQLAEHLHLTPAGTTSLVDRLEGAGLAERRSGVLASDRRAVLVRLTPRGRRAVDDLVALLLPHRARLVEAFEPTTRGLAPADASAVTPERLATVAG
jgi:DNA-binding MarR family transcriptional regulator